MKISGEECPRRRKQSRATGRSGPSVFPGAARRPLE